MSREVFKAAKLAAMDRYKRQAQLDMNAATTKRRHDNAIRRFNLCVQKEVEYQTEFWTAEREREYAFFKDCDDIASIPPM